MTIINGLTWLANVEGIVFPLVIMSAGSGRVGEMGLHDLHCCNEEQNGLRITERFPKLRPLPSVIRSDCLIFSDPLNGHFLLSLGEPFRICLVVRHIVEKKQGKCEIERSKEEEKDFPSAD